MSSININRAVENIRSGTTIYTPVIELIVNAIDAIRKIQPTGGEVHVKVLREGQQNFEDGTPAVCGFEVSDNGVGFNEANLNSFDTLYSDLKAEQGGKGFGRFTCLKYFDSLEIESTFLEAGTHLSRSFEMGRGNDIIVNQTISDTDRTATGSVVRIDGIRGKKFPDKTLETIAKVLVEKLLPFFIDESFVCPQILIFDESGRYCLNDYLHRDDAKIIEVSPDQNSFLFDENGQANEFNVRVFKILAPRSPRSRVSLVAHRREVTETSLQTYIPEFAEEFYAPGENGAPSLNYIIKSYVFGNYLDDNVLLERGGFAFGKESDLLHPITQTQIEREAAEITVSAVGDEIVSRRQRKEQKIQEYIDERAPWHRKISKRSDYSALPMNPSEREIEIHLQSTKFQEEQSVRAAVQDILSSEDTSELEERINRVLSSISQTGMNDLAHYVSLRKCVLDLFEKSLEFESDGRFHSEAKVHSIVMPRYKDTDEIDFEDHNLWILDERLNFAQYVTSDKFLNGAGSDRTDISVFDKRVAFRGENEPSNPITIFEFKRPGRDDFTNPSSTEDPVQQIVRYVNEFQDGKHRMPTGREIRVSDTTPFYGYVVCDLSSKVRTWLDREKDFTPMPDNQGFFRWFGNIHLYVEVLSWSKVLEDAKMRNRIFFHKLGIG